MEHFWNKIEGWVGDNPTYRMALDRAQDGSKFVEVGVYLGRTAAFMAVEIINRGLKNVRFDAIDNFQGVWTVNDPYAAQAMYEACIENLRPVRNQVNLIKGESLDIVSNYEDNSLDFVFIDASHDYDSVMADLEAWYPKVKNGGLFAGDDYMQNWPGVIKAVDEFSNKHGVVAKPVPNSYHWYIEKPEL